MENNLKYWLWLSLCSGLSGELRMFLLEEFSSNPMKIYQAEPSELESLKLSQEIISSLGNKNLDRVNHILGVCDRLGIFHITYQDTIYPSGLRAIANPPIVLYGKGKMPRIEDQPTIAMVGAREASQYGYEMASSFAYDLTRGKAVVVTGMAEGIDTACVHGALKAGGPMVSVVAGGVDMAFPKESARLYADVPCVGALLSEYPPGTPHRATHFRYRNRILSGMSTGVMIVESNLKGGTMLTAGIAVEQQKDIFVLPGDIRIPTMSGNIRLMQTTTCYVVGHPEHILQFYKNKYPLQAPLGENQGIERLSDIPERTTKKVTKPKKTKSEKATKTRKKEEKASPEESTESEESSSSSEFPPLIEVSPDGFTEMELCILKGLGEEICSQDAMMEWTKLGARELTLILINLETLSAITPVADRFYRALVKVKEEAED